MRTSFEGDGPPIQLEAMPDANLAMAGNSATYVLESGDFIPQEYMDVGFTHYQVWAVGAAGGQGGGANSQLVFDRTFGPKFRMSDAMWALERERVTIRAKVDYNYMTPAQRRDFDIEVEALWHTYGDWWTPQPLSWYEAQWYSLDEAIRRALVDLEASNPNHLTYLTYWTNPQLVPTGADGGAGGGGGIQMASGVLADLPEVVPVYVGRPGAEGSFGHNMTWNDSHPGFVADSWFAGVWRPTPAHNYYDYFDFRLHRLPYDSLYGSYYGSENYGYRMSEIENALTEYKHRWETVDFHLPGVGQDGEASYFGDIAQASGGKGGNPIVKHKPLIYQGPILPEGTDIGGVEPDGKGGAGGIGGTLIAGGGAPGGSLPGQDGADGSWDGEIGSGGGGGRTGARVAAHIANGIYIPEYVAPMSDGGRGALSFVDTSIFGDRGKPGPTKAYKAVEPIAVLDPVIGKYKYTYVYVENGVTKTMYVPGFGGGSKPLFKKFGSRAATYSPEGAVLIRLTKQT